MYMYTYATKFYKYYKMQKQISKTIPIVWVYWYRKSRHTVVSQDFPANP